MLLCVVLPLVIRAQSANPAIWCPTGAVWTYGYGVFNEFGTVTVRYQRDTLVAGQPAQLLTRQIQSSFWVFFPTVSVPGPAYRLPSVVTRVVADRVEVLANGQFRTLYDFAATPGSTWLTAPVAPQGACPQGLVLVTVDSVGRQLVGGRSLRWFRAHLAAAAGTTAAGSWPGRIYEQLGNVAQYMQPQSPICHGTDPGFMGSLVSFRATGWPSIGYNSTSGTLLASAAGRGLGGFAVFPTPATVRLTLQLPTDLSGGAELRLFDLAGRLLRRQATLNSHEFDLRDLPAGIYTLVLQQPGQLAQARRVVVE